MVDRLTKLVGLFEGMDLSANRADGDDLLGEYLMRHFATESGKSKGQFYTPAEVSRILAKVVGITGDTPPVRHRLRPDLRLRLPAAQGQRRGPARPVHLRPGDGQRHQRPGARMNEHDPARQRHRQGYRLEVIERRGRYEVRQKGRVKLQLFVGPGTEREGRQRALGAWYRRELKQEVACLTDYWLPEMGLEGCVWQIKRMKTKWGNCNAAARRIWLNLELVQKPPECLEYILVHELVHLFERHHNDRFRALMDQYLPDWRERRDLLNRAPLANASWQY